MRLMPAPEADGFFIRTLNNQGFMAAYASDPYMQQFITFAAQGPGPALDIGAAYGVATVDALKNGARVIANEIDARHLEILRQRLTPEQQARLTCVVGQFPNEIDFPDGTIGSILIARVLHFFRGEQIEAAAETMRRWLAPGGKVFITAETPYLKNHSWFIPIYEERLRQKQYWPGFVDDYKSHDTRKGFNLPDEMHFLDPQVLTRTFTNAGFQIEKCDFFARPEFPETLRYDGRESVGLIARV